MDSYKQPQNIEAEQQVLGACLVDKQVAEEVRTILSPDDFYLSGNGHIFEGILHALDNDKTPDTLTVMEYLQSKELLKKVGGVTHLASLPGSVASTAFAVQHAKIVELKSVERKVIAKVERIKSKAYMGEYNTPTELLNYAESELININVQTDSGGLEHVSGALQGVMEDIENRCRTGKVNGIPTGYPELTAWLAGYQKSDLIILAARPSMGKAQPISSKVLTKTGWVEMGSINIGDELASINGEPSKVVGIYPQGEQQIYKITFSDGRKARCTGDHLWTVKSSRWDGYRVITTNKLISMLDLIRYKRRISIPLFGGDFGNEEELPIHPWLLGALIGNGNLTNCTPIISTSDAQTLFEVQRIIGSEMLLTYASGYDYRIRATKGKNNKLMADLRELGMAGCKSDEKYIPQQYLMASKQARIRLLQGLLDTDGWVESFGSIRYSTSSEVLAQNVQELVRSLGGLCTVSTKSPYYTYKGERKKGKTHYICNIRIQDQEQVITLIRKKRRCTKTPNTALTIVSIVPDGVEPVQCIKVSHDSQLYVTDDYVVTHNTTFAIQEAKDMAVRHNKKVAFFSLEMSKRSLIEKLLINEGFVSAQSVRVGRLRPEEWSKITQAAATLIKAGVYIDDSSNTTTVDIAHRCRRLKAKHGLDMVFVDYLGLIKPTRRESRHDLEIGAISRDLKFLAKELSCPVMVLSQLSRKCEERDNKRPMTSDLRDSGNLEQDKFVA